MKISKNAHCPFCSNAYQPDAKFCCRCGAERGTGKTSELGSRGNSKRGSNEDIKDLVQEQLARHRSVILSSLDEFSSQIAGHVQAFQDRLEGELSSVRKENHWFKTVPARRHSLPTNGIGKPTGSSRVPAELGTSESIKCFEAGILGSVEVLDLESADHLEMKEEVTDKQSKNDVVTAFDSSTDSDPDVDLFARDPAEKKQSLPNNPASPQDNHSLTGVVPLPQGEAPKTTIDMPEFKLNEQTMDPLDSMMPMKCRRISEEQRERTDVDTRSDDEKNNFKVLECWADRKRVSGKKLSGWQRATAESRRHTVTAAQFDEEGVRISRQGETIYLSQFSNEGTRDKCEHSCVIHPNSVLRGCWDMASLIMVFYDLVFIPLMLLDLPYSTFAAVAAWITRIFWTFDLFLSPITGYIKSDGSIEMRPRRILTRYLKSWFCVDLFIVLVDWLEMYWAAGSGLGFARLGKASRIFRILRLVRLLRLIRMMDIMRDFMERMHSERLVILASILKIMLVICGMAHLMACIWYRVGNTDDGRSWIRDQLYNSDSLEYKYMTSLHWSISQFSGGMDEVRPQNLGERVYAIVCFLIAFIMAGVFISSITSSMTQLHFLSSRKSQQLNVLRRFLGQHGISHRLAVRVQRNATHAIDQQEHHMPESNVEILELVSTPLRSRVHFEMFAPTFRVHPFFAKYVELCPHVMRRVCHSATSMSMTSNCDVIFNAGEIAAEPAMYIVCTGILAYVSLSGNKYRLNEDAVLAEAVLWTTWMHQGTLTAETNSHLLVLDAHSFQYIVNQFEHIDLDPRQYAEKFVRDINEGDRELSDLPRHLQEDYGGSADILADMRYPSKKRKADRIFGRRHSQASGADILNSDMIF